jgi:rod shape determining protein RodA
MEITAGRSRSRSWVEPLRRLDPVLLGAAVLLSVIGLFMIYSATHTSLQSLGLDSGYFVKKQIAALVVGLVAMGFVLALDYRLAKVYAMFFYGGMILLLLLVRTPLGTAAKGAQRGFSVLGFQLTPSEGMKIALVVMLAAYLSELKERDLGLRELMRAVTIAAVPMFLVLLQPDVGTTIVLATILVGVVIVAGARVRHLGVLALAAAIFLAGAFQVGLIKQYQIDRLTGFLDPKNDAAAAHYNRDQSEIAIGSGGLTGTGYLRGIQTNLDFVPEQHTDFIFTVVGEQFGFVGAMALLVLYAVLLWRAFRTAMASKDPFGTYVAAGIAAMFAVQMFVNIGMTLGIMPITGIPLPFVSYGGSSLIANFIAVGLLLSIRMRRGQLGS